MMLALVLAPGCAESEGGEDAAATEEAAEGDAETTGDDAEKKEGDDEDADKEEEEPKKKKKKKESSTTVSASPVTRGDLVIPIIAEGTVRARHATDLKFEISGRVERVFVKEGQRVRRGQKLATLDDREYRVALEEAKARYLQGLGQLAVEEEGYDSKTAERSLEEQLSELKKLETDGVITRSERLDRELELGMTAVRDGAYRRELLEVRSGLSTSRADISRLELDLEKTVVRAPFSGVITDLELASKENVQAGQLLARLVDDINIEAEVGVLESDLAGVQVGRPALVTIPALGETLELKVDVISPEIDQESRTCRVLLRLKADDGKVKPGMFVRAAIAGQIHEEKLLVPREAVLTRDGRPVVFRVEDSRAKWVYVKLGMRNDHLVEIARVTQGGPLDDGTLIVVDNHLTLTHDAKVKIKKELPISDPWLASVEQQ